MTLKKRFERICYPGLLLATILALAGCASSPASANSVRRSETGQAHALEKGEVIYAREVTIEGEARGAGGIGGVSSVELTAVFASCSDQQGSSCTN